MTYAVMLGAYGWMVLRTEDGVSIPVATVGGDQALAEQIRDWLPHRDRIGQLLERHGLVDVPLDQMEGQ